MTATVLSVHHGCMERQHLPLLLASTQFARSDESEPLDRLRMQKGVFLLEQKGPADWRDLYQYRPYNWGPYSDELAADVNNLLAGELLEREPWPERRYAGYKTTPAGEQVARAACATLTPQYADFIARVRRFVTTRSFNQLLRDVYAEFPAFAVASQFRG
jgi:hypothetical protein